jgi:hypothetical protein
MLWIRLCGGSSDKCVEIGKTYISAHNCAHTVDTITWYFILSATLALNYAINPLSRNVPQCARLIFFTCLKAVFQSSHEAPRSSLRVLASN